jgi:hypothetical protein
MPTRAVVGWHVGKPKQNRVALRDLERSAFALGQYFAVKLARFCCQTGQIVKAVSKVPSAGRRFLASQLGDAGG